MKITFTDASLTEKINNWLATKSNLKNDLLNKIEAFESSDYYEGMNSVIEYHRAIRSCFDENGYYIQEIKS